MQVSSSNGFHLRGVLDNNINYILGPHLTGKTMCWDGSLTWCINNDVDESKNWF